MRCYVGLILFLVFCTFFFVGCEKDDNDLPDVVNQAPAIPSNPVPANHAVSVAYTTTLHWSCFDSDHDSVRYRISFNVDTLPETQYATTTDTFYNVTGLHRDTGYQWRITADDGHNPPVSGPVWTFSTSIGYPPPVYYTPENNAVNVSVMPTLRWQNLDPSRLSVRYTVYLDTVNPPQTVLVSDLADSFYTIDRLRYSTNYYWQVNTVSGNLPVIQGAIWHFTSYALLERTFPLGTSGATIDMVWIRPGSYWMGNTNQTQPGTSGPSHLVTLDYGFWIGKYEVTQTQWISLMDYNPSRFIGENLPVERVRWDSIHVFLDTLNRQSGDTLWRLPSEAEWEYACRAGSTTRFYWGDDPDYSLIEQYEWFGGRYSGVSHPVGLKRPNPWGLYDMSGNVSEWCEDDWHETYVGAPTDGSAWIDSPRYASKVARGGRYNDYPWNCISANRFVLGYYNYQSVLGFRLVRNPD